MKKWACKWEPQAVARGEAGRELPELLRHYFRRGDRAARPKTSEKRLHEFRLATKHTRYTLELFQPLYGAAIKPHLDGLKKIQQVLGQLNDCQATLELLGDFGAPCDPHWRQGIELRRDRKRGEFAQLWLDEFTDEAKRAGWLQVLE
jgi:CHAD domain-containing protein